MVKVLLAVLLLGLSFSGQAHWEECTLDRVSHRIFSSYGYKGKHKNAAIKRAEQEALDKCRAAGYLQCEITSSWAGDYRPFAGFRASATAAERDSEATDEEPKWVLCSNINSCIEDGRGSSEQLEVLFEMNECYDHVVWHYGDL